MLQLEMLGKLGAGFGFVRGGIFLFILILVLAHSSQVPLRAGDMAVLYIVVVELRPRLFKVIIQATGEGI